MCSNYRGITPLSLPGKIYLGVLDRRVRQTVKPLIMVEQCGFRPGRGKVDQLYTLSRVCKGAWEFVQPVHMCFVDHSTVSLGESCRGFSGILGCRAPLCRLSAPCMPGFTAWTALPAVSRKTEREIDRQMGAETAVIRNLCRSVVVERKGSRKVKLSIYWSTLVPTLTYGHKLWVVTAITRLRVQVAEMSFISKVAGLTDRVRSSTICSSASRGVS